MFRILVSLLMLSIVPPALSEGSLVKHNIDRQSGLEDWFVEQDGFQIHLLQVRPDNVKAFYLGRDFPVEMATRISEYCVMTIRMRNTGTVPASYDLSKWEYISADGSPKKFMLKEDWLREWKKSGITMAFTQLPSTQTFETGDWNGSLITLRLAHGEKFTLRYQWQRNNQIHAGVMEGLRCAKNPE